jgi:anaerobic selenocysteine-containing dehydrogenase
METPGRGQIRALVTYAGNPVLSVPNGRRLSRALEGLEFMVSIDIYLNETTRHADLILPPAWALAEDHFDLLMANHQVRNTARWCAPVVARGEDERADWEILLALAERMGGGATGIGPVDAAIKAARYVGLQFTPDALAALLIRVGPWGDRFVPGSKGLSREKLEAAPHGIDLGPLQPGITPRVLHRDKRVKLAPPPIVAALPELARSLDAEPARELLLIGRRELRTCNSWMHNVAALVSGRDRCVLWVNPEDAEARGLGDGDLALLESRVHKGTLTVELHPDLAPGAVSLPHGWGHAEAAPWQRVAGAHAGVSMNDWTDDADVERVVGQSILTGIPVRLSRSSG